METYVLNREMNEAIQEVAELIKDAPREQLLRYGRAWRQSDHMAVAELYVQTDAAAKRITHTDELSTDVREASMLGALLGVALARTVRKDVQFGQQQLRNSFDKVMQLQQIEVKESVDDPEKIALQYENTLPASGRATLRGLHHTMSHTHADISYIVMLYSLYALSDEVHIPRDLSQIVHDVDEDEFDNILAAIYES